MSAIVAVVREGLGEGERAWLERAVAVSRAAGPDGTGVHVADRCALGHALLRTSARDVPQPVSLGDDLWLAGDVRLDSRERLASAAGADPACDDAELVLHAYRRWGDGCLDRLAGDFAFACWDAGRRRLLCARDQLGVTPLHYAFAGDRLLVASAIDALLAHPAVADDLDERWIASFLASGRPPDHVTTAFAHVRRLPPAHALTWEAGTVRIRRYWRLPAWEPLVRFPNANDYGERLRDLLDRAVADRLTQDRTSVLLSGGLDSTSVAASSGAVLRARHAPDGALLAITVGLGGASGDREPEFAARVAARIGARAEVIEEAASAAVDPLADPVVRNAEPVHFPATTAAFAPALVAAAHGPVALTGQGGDPLLHFESWYWLEWTLRGRLVRALRSAVEPARVLRERPHPGLLTLARGLRRPPLPSLPQFLDPDFARRTQIESLVRRPPRFDRATTAGGLASEVMWPDLFERGDPAFHGLPVKMRHPLADLRLIAFVRSLPPDPWLVGKRVLRDAGRGRLPREVLARPKAPLVKAPRPAVAPAVLGAAEQLLRASAHAPRFFDPDALAAAARAQAAAGGWREMHHVARAVGLLYWLQHRQPLASIS